MGRVAQSESTWRARTALRVFAEVGVLLIVVGVLAEWRDRGSSASASSTTTTTVARTTTPSTAASTTVAPSTTTTVAPASTTTTTLPRAPSGQGAWTASNTGDHWKLTTLPITAYLGVNTPSQGCVTSVTSTLQTNRDITTSDPSLQADTSPVHTIVANTEPGNVELNRASGCGGNSTTASATDKPVWTVTGVARSDDHQHVVLTLSRSISVTISDTTALPCLQNGPVVYADAPATNGIATDQGGAPASLSPSQLRCP